MSQLIMTSLPGFVDIDHGLLDAHEIITDDKIVKIAQNAKFAAIRLEVIFMGFYQNGDTVPTPVSPVDGYKYGRDEVLYDICFYATRAPGVGFVSGQAEAPAIAPNQPANLYWQRVDVDDSTGVVSIDISYYRQGGAETITHDGMLKIYAICQRVSVNTPS